MTQDSPETIALRLLNECDLRSINGVDILKVAAQVRAIVRREREDAAIAAIAIQMGHR